MTEYKYISLELAYEVHKTIIDTFGGLHGLKDRRMSSVLELMQIDDYYCNFEDKLTHLVHSVAKNHSFTDGNKRTSIALGALFLLMNDFPQEIVSEFIQKMEALVLMAVENTIEKEELLSYIMYIIYDMDMPEEMSTPLEERLKIEQDNE